MIIGLKIFATGVGIYVGCKLTGIAISWLKLGLNKLKPRKED